MTPEEHDLRRALAARGGSPSPAFRSRLSTALAQGRPATDIRRALAVVAAIVLSVGTIGLFALLRQSQHPRPLPAQASPVRGATPSPVPSPSASSTPIPLPTSAQFSAPTGTEVWALVANAVLFISTDQGNAWQQRALPPSPPNIEISFVSDREGWLSSAGSPETQCNGESVTLWQTTDGAKTWQQVSTSSWQQQSATGIGYRQCKSGLSFIDETHGFLTAWDSNHAPVIYRTADGGNTWAASAPLPDPPGFTTSPGGFTLRAGRVHRFGSVLLVDAYGQSANSGQLSEYVFRSTNGGATWTHLATLPNTAVHPAFVTASRWLALIIRGQSQETLDAGKTWHAYPSDYSQAAPVSPDIIFASTEVGYASVRGGLQRTVDGGLHWTPLRTPGT